MRVLVLVCLLAAAVPRPLPGQDVTLTEYAARREGLRKALDGGAFLLIGATESPQGDLHARFSQESNFYYLTGWSEPGAMLAIAPDSDVLFVPRRDPERDRWTGRKVAAGDERASELTGFNRVQAVDTFEAWLVDNAASWPSVYTLIDQPGAARVGAMLPKLALRDAGLAVTRLRSRKSAAELALLRRSARVTMDAHRAAWLRLRPGLFEYQIAATMTNVYLEAGCERDAYPPVVASGPSGVIIHYYAKTRRIEAGELLLMDVGAECGRYVADIARTVPVDGKFTERQRELYEIVLGVQKAVIAAVKPGMMLAKRGPNSLYDVAMEHLDQHGLGEYFTHGIGHPVGLDVHDAEDPDQPLVAGMVITIEPGIYIPDEGIGIRIEDMVLVTEDGAELLTAELPREAAGIEQALAGRY